MSKPQRIIIDKVNGPRHLVCWEYLDGSEYWGRLTPDELGRLENDLVDEGFIKPQQDQNLLTTVWINPIH